MREYETITILRPDLLEEGVERVKGRVVQVVDRMGGRMLRFDNWGKRKLAYEVKKYPKGIYLYFLYLGGPDVSAEVERNLKMWDDVIRYMTVKLEHEVDPEQHPTEISDEELERAALAAAKPFARDDRPMAPVEEEPEPEQSDDADDADDDGEEG